MSKNVKFTYEDGSSIKRDLRVYESATNGKLIKIEIIEEEESFAVEAIKIPGCFTPVSYKKLKE